MTAQRQGLPVSRPANDGFESIRAAGSRPHEQPESALPGRPRLAFVRRVCGIGSHLVCSAERLKPVRDGALEGVCSATAIRRTEVPKNMRSLDRGIFEPLRGKFDLPIKRVRSDQPVEPARYRLQPAAQYRFPGRLGDKGRPCHQSRGRRQHSLQNGLFISYSASTRVSPISRSIRSSNRASSSRLFLRRRHSRSTAPTPLRKLVSRCGNACQSVSSGIRSGRQGAARDNSALVFGSQARLVLVDR